MATLKYKNKGGTCADCANCRYDGEIDRLVCLAHKRMSFVDRSENYRIIDARVTNKGLLVRVKCKDKFKQKDIENGD